MKFNLLEKVERLKRVMGIKLVTDWYIFVPKSIEGLRHGNNTGTLYIELNGEIRNSGKTNDKIVDYICDNFVRAYNLFTEKHELYVRNKPEIVWKLPHDTQDYDADITFLGMEIAEIAVVKFKVSNKSYLINTKGQRKEVKQPYTNIYIENGNIVIKNNEQILKIYDLGFNRVC